MNLPNDPAIVLLGTDPREMKTSVHAETGTCVLTTALFEITKIWKYSNVLERVNG